MPSPSRRPADDVVAPEVVTAVFRSAALNDAEALLVVQRGDGATSVAWANAGAVRLLGHALDDLVALPLDRVLPSLQGGALRLLLRPERAVQMSLPVRAASGAVVDAQVDARPTSPGATWVLRLVPGTTAQERALQATADAHERRFTTLAERSPVPTLLSEQGMRLAHVNDAFCNLVGRPADQLLGTGWTACVHPEDLDRLVELAALALGGGEGEARARLVREDGALRTTVFRFAHVVTPGVGAGFVATIEDVTDRLAFEEQLAHQATHDPLTGLPNRTLLERFVAQRMTPGGSGLACLFLDLDDFKVVNDSLGHDAGDRLLVEVARRLRAAVRPTDLVARFGGDEFVVVCEGVDEPSALALARRVATELAVPVRLGGVEVQPLASVGVTVQTADHRAPGDLVRDCDIAMYQAKAAGRGQVTVLDHEGRAAAREKLRLVSDLRNAIEERALSVVYQPILRSSDLAPVSVEALARWHHPERGAVSPAVFVPLAEESGLVPALGALVLEETCAQLARWTRELGDAAPARAAVNVSSLQLDAALPGQVAAALRRHGLAASRLTVEITESALMRDPDAAREHLQELRDLGVGLAVDDFGTGFSSLAYLRRLPVTTLKVDRSFVAELGEGHAEIAAAVVALAESLGLDTVAEGVETAEQTAALTRMGATHLQGFVFARPMDGSTTAAWFAERSSPARSGTASSEAPA